ncbi:MAG: hypothetical protein ACREBW_07985, partial [Candidatus Micrarchaeaceae archaeon]
EPANKDEKDGQEQAEERTAGSPGRTENVAEDYRANQPPGPGRQTPLPGLPELRKGCLLL